MLLNACKDIGLAVNIGKTKYIEVGRHRGIIANEHIRIPISLRSILILSFYRHLDFTKSLFPVGIPFNILKALLPSPIQAT